MNTNYGSDAHGLICGYLFQSEAPARPVTLEEAHAWLAATPAEGDREFVWLHFNLAHAGAEAWMRTHLQLVPEFFDALKDGSRSTRIEDASDELIAVVNDVAYEFSFEPSEIASLWMTVNRRLAVSARQHPLRSIDRLREAVKAGARVSLCDGAAEPPDARPGRRAGAHRARRHPAGRRHRRHLAAGPLAEQARRPGQPAAGAGAPAAPAGARAWRAVPPAAPAAALDAPSSTWTNCASRPRSSRWCCVT